MIEAVPFTSVVVVAVAVDLNLLNVVAHREHRRAQILVCVAALLGPGSGGLTEIRVTTIGQIQPRMDGIQIGKRSRRHGRRASSIIDRLNLATHIALSENEYGAARRNKKFGDASPEHRIKVNASSSRQGTHCYLHR